MPDPQPGEALPPGYLPPPPARSAFAVPYGPLPHQLFDVHYPAAQSGGVIVFLHGGAWISGDRTGVSPLVMRQVARGWVVVSVEYALSSWSLDDDAAVNPFPAAIYDVKRALRFLKAYGWLLGVDPTTLVVWGESAGGHLAGLAATSAGGLEPQGLPPELAMFDSRPDGAVVLAGPLDMTEWITHVREFTGGTAAERDAALQLVQTLYPVYFDCRLAQPETCDLLRVSAASAHAYFDPSDPPVYLGFGGRDALVPAAQSLRLIDAYVEAGLEDLLWADYSELAGHDVAGGLNLVWLDAFLDLVKAFGT